MRLLKVCFQNMFCRLVKKWCLFLCRAIIGELDEEADADIDFDKIRAPPMKEVTH